MARNIMQTVYKFSELSDAAKATAKYNWQCGCGFNQEDECLASIQALAKHFGGKMTRYEVDWFNSSYSCAKFDMPELTREEIQERLLALGDYNKETFKGFGEAILTGHWADDDAIDGFRIAFFGGESDLDELMEDAFRTWLAACQDECEGFYDDENFAEHCDGNGLEFFENGNAF